MLNKTQKKGGKRKINKYFKIMLDAKKSNKKSFTYNKQIYIGKKHNKLGMIYKKKGGAPPNSNTNYNSSNNNTPPAPPSSPYS